MNSSQIKIALMKTNARRNRQLIRESIHLPFSQRISSRSVSTANSSDIDSDEIIDHHTFAQEDKITLNHEILEKCKSAFSKFDLNGDGTIDQRELRLALLTMGFNPSDQELKEMMNDIDQNGDDKLDLIEFLRVIQSQRKNDIEILSEKEKNEINIQEAWKILSDTNTGKMKVSTFKKTLKQFDLAMDVDTLIKALDVDNSGFVDFNEFHELFTDAQ